MLRTRPLISTLDRMTSLNRVLDEALASAWPQNGSRVWVPAMDVAEQSDAYVVHVELPGVAQADIDISFEQNVLTIRGTKQPSFDPQREGEVRVFAAERVSGEFERSLRLPEFVDGDAISAEYANGLLRIRIPKAQAAQARKIEVKPAQGQIGSAN